MNEVILCLVVLCFLVWVLLLMIKIANLKMENKKLRDELQRLSTRVRSKGEIQTTPYHWAKHAGGNLQSEPAPPEPQQEPSPE